MNDDNTYNEIFQNVEGFGTDSTTAPPETEEKVGEKPTEAEQTDNTESVTEESTTEVVEEEEESSASELKQEAKPDSKQVPLSRYLTEKKAWKAKQDEFEAKLQQLTGILAETIKQLPRQQQKAEEPPPDPLQFVDADPKLAAIKSHYDKELGELKAQVVKSQAKDVAAQVFDRIAELERNFTQEKPDYYDALNHIRDRTRQAAKAFKPDASDHEVDQFILQQDLKFTQDALNQGINPAKYAYTLATMLYGYQPRAGTNTNETEGAKQSSEDMSGKFDRQKKAAPVSKNLGARTAVEEEEGEELDGFMQIMKTAVNESLIRRRK